MGNQRVQQLLVAIVFGHAFQHQRAGASKVDFINRLVNRTAQQPLDPRIVGQLQKTAHPLNQIPADLLGILRLAEPFTDQHCRFMAMNKRDQRLGIEEFFFHEAPKIFTNPVFVARDNCGVARDKRQRHPSKQRHHGEPVSQRADHRRLGNGL